MESRRRALEINEMGTEHNLRSLVLRCLTAQIDDRPTLQDIVNEMENWREREERKKRIARTDKPTLKIVVLGKWGAGKSCLTLKYTDPGFPRNMEDRPPRTEGFLRMMSSVIINRVTFRLAVHDTGGQERFLCIVPNMLRDTDGVLIAIDLSDRESLKWVQNYIELGRTHAGNDVQIILVGTKVDLEKERQVSKSAAENLAQRHRIPYIETSAFTGHNVVRAFEDLAGMVFNRLQLSDIGQYAENSGQRVVGLRENHGATANCCHSH